MYLSDAQDNVDGRGEGINGPHKFTANNFGQGQRHWLT